MLALLLSMTMVMAAGDVPTPQEQWDDKEEQKCFDAAMTQPAMTGCADAAYQRADKRLNAQWAKTTVAYKRVDEDNKKAGQETGAFDSLLKGQRAWLTYRQATCHAQGLVNAGGTIRGMNELLCLASITNSRTKELILLSQNPNSDEPL